MNTYIILCRSYDSPANYRMEIVAPNEEKAIELAKYLCNELQLVFQDVRKGI